MYGFVRRVGFKNYHHFYRDVIVMTCPLGDAYLVVIFSPGLPYMLSDVKQATAAHLAIASLYLYTAKSALVCMHSVLSVCVCVCM